MAVEPNEPLIKSPEDLLRVVVHAQQKLKPQGHPRGAVVWFRGQPKSSMKVLPKVFRPILKPGYAEGRFSRGNETTMARLFCAQAQSRHAACPPESDLVGWLCLMQHYGLPTRLLDWTESIFVAAFFAIADRHKYREEKENPVIWALNPQMLNSLWHPAQEAALFRLRDEALLNLVQPMFDKKVESEEKVVAVIPPHIDQRISLQRSIFTLHGTSKPLEEIESVQRGLMKFEISFDAIELFTNNLVALGFSASALFPDLGHLASDLREQFEGHALLAAERGGDAPMPTG